MPHRSSRRFVAITLVAGLSLAAFAVLRGAGLDEAPTTARLDPSARVVTAVPPTPTPPPWLGSVLAAAVPLGDGEGIVLHDVGAEGPGRLLVSGFDAIGRVAWSPDGGTLAFAGQRGANWDIYQVGRDGTALARLTEHPAHDAWPTWSPDGRQVAFTSYRDDTLDLYRLTVEGSGQTIVERVTTSDGPAIEPAWSPDGAWLAFAAWADGGYRIEAVRSDGTDRRVVFETDERSDMRTPAWSPDGHRIAYVERRYGPGQLVARPWPADGGRADGNTNTDTDDDRRLSTHAVASQVDAFDWFPGGDALAAVTDERYSRPLEIRDSGTRGRYRVALLPRGAGDVSWSRGSMPSGLAEVPVTPTPVGSPFDEATEVADIARPGLVRLADVDVPGDRIHAGLADDFAAMRAEVRAGVGVDFLGTLADGWRSLGYNGSSFFSWHKTGRAFDTQMELWGPGGRRDMVLVREDVRGRTMWRMYLRAAAQDGSVGVPLVEPGWTFTAGGGDPDFAAEGGQRGRRVPDGYWLDFTAVAERYGWQRIPSLTRGNLNWRSSWSAIDYWHYERRDGLRWFDAARQVYSDEELDAELRADRLREQGVSLGRLTWLGFPSGWLREG